MLYVDMDGVLAKWKLDATNKEINTQGYFLNREPMVNMILAIKTLISKGANVIILSVAIDTWAIEEKKTWLSIYLPEINENNMLFVPPGISKSDYIDIKSDNDILIDDFSKNLFGWHGIGIKVMNGINGNYGTWKGYSIVASDTAVDIANNIARVICKHIIKPAYS